MLEFVYAAAVVALRGVALVVAPVWPRLAGVMRGRRQAMASLLAWGRAHRDDGRPLVWIHAPSVGEGLQARAVIEALKGRVPDGIQSVFTHFSPSAEVLVTRMPVDWAGYLPWDVSGDIERALDAVRPSLVAFTKTEVWPVLSRACERRGIPTALVAATLPAGSSRVRPWARRLLAPSLGRLALVAAIAEEDGDRFVAQGAERTVVEVTGDPGVDAAVRRLERLDPDAPYLRPLLAVARPTVVAGSTWPPDEAVLLPALARLRGAHTGLRVVVAPHEPDPDHVEPLLESLRRDGWDPRRLSEVEAEGELGGVDAVVVDRVGVLAHLYRAADVAFVGGGFHGAGLHSVLEPAAAGVPVLFGPAHHNAWAAAKLVEAGAGSVVHDSESLAGATDAWLTDSAGRSSAGAAAREWIERHRGAADRTGEALSRLLRPA